MKQTFLILSLLLFSHCIQAEVYKCVDGEGKTRYQASPCAGIVIPIDEWQPAPKPVAGNAYDFGKDLPIGHRSERSEAAKNLFKSFHPCPSTGDDRGPCPGYVVDHIKPLACGGADDPRNMQWQTVASGKAKDRWERIGCQPASIHAYHPATLAKPATRHLAGGEVRIGPRGGRYIVSPSGRKHYLNSGIW